MRQKLWHGLNAEHWRLALVENGWPAPAATLMADALVRLRPLPRWGELHPAQPTDAGIIEDYGRQIDG